LFLEKDLKEHVWPDPWVLPEAWRFYRDRWNNKSAQDKAVCARRSRKILQPEKSEAGFIQESLGREERVRGR
jgi:hypothetical protein